MHIAGGKAGSSSELLALWQFSAAPGFTGSISGNTLQVTSLTSGWNNLAPGELIGGGRIPPGTTISAMGTGSGGPGTYQISGPPLSVPSEGMYVNWFTLPKMTPGTAHIQVPAGHRVTAVTDIITGAKVNAGQQGQNLTVPVGDDPVSVLIEAQ